MSTPTEPEDRGGPGSASPAGSPGQSSPGQVAAGSTSPPAGPDATGSPGLHNGVEHHAPIVPTPQLPSMPSEVAGVGVDVGTARPDQEGLSGRIKTLLIGKPRDLADQSIFHSTSR